MKNLYEIVKRIEVKIEENDRLFLTGIRESFEYVGGTKGNRNGSVCTVLIKSLNESVDVLVPQLLEWEDDLYLKPVKFKNLTIGLRTRTEWRDGSPILIPFGLKGLSDGLEKGYETDGKSVNPQATDKR